jgi:hypothetical protein
VGEFVEVQGLWTWKVHPLQSLALSPLVTWLCLGPWEGEVKSALEPANKKRQGISQFQRHAITL